MSEILLDLAFLSASLTFLAVCVGYAGLCDRL